MKESAAMRTMRIIGFILALGMMLGVTPAVKAAEPPDALPGAYDLTPPRLSLAEGQVSFWRPGADDWTTAQVNTPLVPGDEISTNSPGNIEIQIGSHAFVRGWTNTQIGLENQEEDFIQFKLTDGSAAFDLRRLERGRTVEVDTPNAAFTIAQPGYYRVDVTGDRTSFITRRAGRATVIPSGGAPLVVTSSEELVIDGTSAPRAASYVAPQPDTWDQWNYARTDKLLEAVSGRYVAPEMYGESDLDQYGTWRVVSSYGSVWVPTGQRTGWTPYSTGSWVRDPFYGWTWVDSAPWGWAPYHYGRWVFVDGYWAWAPGPVVTRPVYAPALVAFFGGPGVSVSVNGPLVGWVALGWGEPVVPWWGRPGFIHEPSWRGWGGPRVVNNVVVTNTTVVNVQNINVYRNVGVRNAVVVVNENRFGHGPITSAREARVDEKSLRVTHEAPQIAARPASFVPTDRRGIRPPEASLKRSVVATRPPRVAPDSTPGGERRIGPTGVPAPAPRLVSAPSPREGTPVPDRPPFGQSTVERPVTVRTQPPSPPRARPSRESRVAGTPPAADQHGRVAPPPSGQRVDTPQATAPAPAVPPSQAAQATPSTRAETPSVAAPTVPSSQAVRPISPATRTETPPVAAPTVSSSQVARPAPPPARTETPPIAAPAVSSSQAARSTPPAGRIETPQVAAPVPPPLSSSPAATPSPPRRIEPPQTVSPSPATRAIPPTRRIEVPQGAAPVTTASPAPPVQATSPARRIETPHVAATPPTAPASSPARVMSADRRPEPSGVVAPATSPPARRRAAPPQGVRPEGSGQPAPRLPGEPANRLAPSRGEARPPQREQQ
ncbi:MAG TPA: DUF6600 domain-containing protein [Acidimicrobiales bacterium]